MYDDIWRIVSSIIFIKVASLLTRIYRNKIASSASAWLPLLYDTVVLVLTLRRTFPSLRNRANDTTLYIMKRVLEDGLIYYRQVSRMASARDA